MRDNDFSEKFNQFRRLRDKSLSELKKCKRLWQPDKIEKMGFVRVRSEYFSEGIEEHEFHEFEKDNGRVVYLESYIDREGGMYIQSLFASPDLINLFESEDSLLK